ncbi:uncharacterized protein DSM5745_04464 [Aspergillus mulundensis]|uniref:DUF7136 domain-containing protein n=1 Tax=Aspergillus mulundensis TaxID=1810919 RepID=A0A3D8SEF4_9EURO|nr:Uncharacterized protein DSM5745_04464 [Aspergillus mulundensis]RDW84138.1 Uncharacterized protein DSM5745_04464 [Aspergillus mulundensis]
MVRLSWLALGLVAGAVSATAENKTEIDLIFPREGTFAPKDAMPVVFAIQNAPVAKDLRATIEYGIFPKGRRNETVRSYADYLSNIPENTTTYFSSSNLDHMLNKTGSWEFFWQLYWMNCSWTQDPAYNNTDYPWVAGALGGLNLDVHEDGFHNTAYRITAGSLSFETAEGGTDVNLTTLTSSDKCSGASGFVFPSLVKDLDYPFEFPQTTPDEKTCPQLASSSMASATDNVSPCKVSISPEAEASILAVAECHNSVWPTSGCPDKKEKPKDDAAAGQDHRQAAWLAALAVALGFGIVGY